MNSAPGAVEVAAGPFTERVWFPGRQVRTGVHHVVRIRSTWDLFNPRYPAAPVPAEALKPGVQGLIIPPPRSLRAVDVDLFVCDRRQYWENE